VRKSLGLFLEYNEQKKLINKEKIIKRRRERKNKNNGNRRRETEIGHKEKSREHGRTGKLALLLIRKLLHL